MNLWKKLKGRGSNASPLVKNITGRRAEENTARPIFARVRPGQAIATPRRYDRLAEEGFAKNVIVLRAVNLVARGLASIPLSLWRGDRRLETHPLLSLLAMPNPTMQGVSFFQQLASHYLLAGNAYIYGAGPDDAPPFELWILRPDTVQIILDQAGLPAAYRQRLGAHQRDYRPEAIVHWKSFNPLSDHYGLAPLEAASVAVDAHNESSRWNLALIQNGGTPSGVLYQEAGEEALSDSQYQSLKREVEGHYSGPLNAGRPLLLEGGLKWQDMGLSPKDMDWAEGKNMAAREIALAFGVAPQLLGIPDSQTYSNFAEARQSLWEDTIIPLARDILGELNCRLVPKFSGDLSLKLDLDELPALEAKRAQRFERITTAAFLSDEEKRAALGFSRFV